MSLPFKPVFRILALVVLLAALPVSGYAQLLYTNGVPDNLDGYQIWSPYATANDFPVLTTTQLGSFDWYALRYGTGGPATITSDFSWSIYNDAGGAIGTSIGNGTVSAATGNKTAFYCCDGSRGYDAYLFSGITLNGLTLGAGQYWLAITGYTDGVNLVGFWATSAQAGNQQTSDGTTWRSDPAEGAFSIYGTEAQSTVPEPASMILLGTGLVGVLGAGAGRRRFRSI